jgi:hypothetical protein
LCHTHCLSRSGGLCLHLIEFTQHPQIDTIGAIVATEFCSTREAESILGQSFYLQQMPEGVSFLWHERIPFVSYPSEWSSEMLHAGSAT